MKEPFSIVEVSSGKGGICAAILATLPTWFGIESSNAAYVRDVETMPMFAAFDGKEAVGFLALKQHSPDVFENYVLGVRPQFHRSGLGRALMTRAEDYARSHAARLLTVKTLSHSHPDPGYALTRKFYQAMGFFPVEEFPTLWNPENPCLMMAKILD
jgi:ribosomal protein S18 acetylase RimI-like enzyme